MRTISICALFFVASWTIPTSRAYLYNSYQQYYGYSNPNTPAYGNQIASQFHPHLYPSEDALTAFSSRPLFSPSLNRPKLNLLVEPPKFIKPGFDILPLIVIAYDDINVIPNPLIVQVSRQRPTMRVKTVDDMLIQCTPAVKIDLEKPLAIFSLQSQVMFPSEMEIVHDGFRIPIKVGAIVVPLGRQVFVSPETPAYVHRVYVIPTKPFSISAFNSDQKVNHAAQSIVVESASKGGRRNHTTHYNLPPRKNVTVLTFPNKEAEPTFHVDEEDAELVNRNPPAGVIPAGIVQSTQPIADVKPFTNSKESPVLTTLREEAGKLEKILKKEGIL